MNPKSRLPQAEKCLRRRCPRLGGEVSFLYCRENARESGVCWKILDCWWETFDVMSYLQDTLDANEFARLTRSKIPRKMSQLIQTLDASQKRVKT